jgi:hypothetical protein
VAKSLDNSSFFLVKAPQALLDWSRTGFDVEDVLGDFPRDAWHFY